MTHKACTNCGAPLPAGQTVKVCEFCGVEVAIEPPPPPPPQRVQPIVVHQFRSPPVYPTRSSGNPGAAIAVVGAVMGLSIAGVVVATTLGRSSASRVGAPNIDIPMPAIPGTVGAGGKARVPLSALHTTPIDWTTDVPIDASTMVGKLDSFDVLGNWDFAMSVGHAWWEDAEMYEVSADPIGKDGTTNVTSAGRVDYHMVSKACRKDHTKRAETEKDLKDSSCSLELTIDKDGPSVRLDLIAPDNTGSSKPLAKPACNIRQAFDQAEKTGKLTKRPAYGIRLVHDVFGLEYRIRNASTAASMDGVDVSPTFCVGKTPTPKTTTTAVSTPQSGTDVPFDQAAMKSALRSANTASCASKTGPAGAGKVNILFANNGTVSSAKAQPPFAGTDKGACWEKAYSSIKVPPFTGSPVSVPVTIAQ